MKRDYDNGIKEGVSYFTGIEIENTQFKGLKTLFVAGYPDLSKIKQILLDDTDIKHVYLGANHFFHKNALDDGVVDIINQLMKDSVHVTLDILHKDYVTYEQMLSSFSSLRKTFCLMLSLPTPRCMWNQSIRFKIDDIDFNATNPGVWVFKASDLPEEAFNDWSEYQKDSPL
jgi:hypothetical protein